MAERITVIFIVLRLVPDQFLGLSSDLSVCPTVNMRQPKFASNADAQEALQ